MKRVAPQASAVGLLRDPALVALVALAASLVAWFAVDSHHLAAQVLTFWTVSPVWDAVLVVFIRRLVANPAVPPYARRFWCAFGLAGCLLLVGDTGEAVLVWLHPADADATPSMFQAGCVIAGIMVIILAMLTYPAAAGSSRERVRFWIDATVVMIGAAVFAWCALIPGSDSGRVSVPALLSSATFLVAAFAAVKLMLSATPPMSGAASAPMLTAAALQGLAIGGLLSPGAGNAHLHLILAVQVLPSILIFLGPRIEEHRIGQRPALHVARTRRRYSLMPYGTLAGMFGLLWIVLQDGLGAQAWVTLGGLLVTTCLVVARQLLAFAENANLLTRLDASLLELGRQEQRMRSLLVRSSDMTSVIDRDGNITFITPAVGHLLGRAPGEVLGTNTMAHLHPDDAAAVAADFQRLMTTPNLTIRFQARYAHADGNWLWLDVVSCNLTLEPSVGGVVSNARDVTEARALQDQLRYQASHDALTGLANRALFGERLAAAGAGGIAAVLLIDLDDFKGINDTYGHHVGDAVLTGVARVLRSCVPTGGIAARLGGDEFAALLPGMDEATARLLVARFHALLDEPMLLDGVQMRVRASVGIVAGEPDDPDALLRLADEAMYGAKRSGKARRSTDTAAESSASQRRSAELIAGNVA